MQTDYDDYDDDENPSMRWMSIVVLLLAVAGFFSLAWYAYYTGTKSVQTGDVVVIEADNRPLKEEPEERGGMEFPHQEKTIYQAVTPNAKSTGETVVIEETEEVVLPEDMPKEEAADKKIAAILQNAANETQQSREPVKQAEKPVQTPAASDAKAPATAAPATQSPQSVKLPVKDDKEAAKAVPEAPKPAPVIAAAPAGSGQYKIQLGAFRSEAEARQIWGKISGQHAVLSGKKHEIIRADLGAKGVYYRLRAGGYPSSASAKSACAALTAKNQGCFPVN